jgi:hypothetical protein
MRWLGDDLLLQAADCNDFIAMTVVELVKFKASLARATKTTGMTGVFAETSQSEQISMYWQSFCGSSSQVLMQCATGC